MRSWLSWRTRLTHKYRQSTTSWPSSPRIEPSQTGLTDKGPSGARRQLIALAEVLALRFPLLENGQLPSQDALGVVGATESEERHGMRDVGGRRDEAHISGPGFVALRTEPKFRRDGLLRTVATEQRIAYVCVQGVLPGAPIGRSSFDNAFAPPRWVTRESPGAADDLGRSRSRTWRDVLA